MIRASNGRTETYFNTLPQEKRLALIDPSWLDVGRRQSIVGLYASDNTFSGDGKQTTDFFGFTDSVSVDCDAGDGKIVAVGCW